MDTYQLTELDVEEVSLVSKGANGKRYLLYKNEAGAPPADPPEEKVDPPAPAPDPVEVIKSQFGNLTPEQRAALAKSLDPTLAERVAKSEEIAKAAQEQVAGLVRGQKLAGYVTIAKSEGFFGKPEDIAADLLQTEERDGAEAVAKRLERERGIAATLKTSALFAEIGKSAHGAGAATDSAEAEVMAKAKELVAKSADPHANYTSKIGEVLHADPVLAARFQAERNGR